MSRSRSVIKPARAGKRVEGDGLALRAEGERDKSGAAARDGFEDRRDCCRAVDGLSPTRGCE